MDFQHSASKLEKEREKRRKIVEEKKKAELKAKSKFEEMEKKMAIAAKERAAQLEIEQAQREIEETRENQLTGGIKFKIRLRPLPCEGEDDKVIVPPSVLESLSKENVFSNGPIMFQIHSVSDGAKNGSRVSHCGVREFTAEDGTIQLPPKVFKSLEDDDISMVEIKYVILPSIKFVKFQPKLNVFSHVGPVKLVLEENLRLHSTLTLGDTVTVWYRGISYELVVKEITPDDDLYGHGGSLVNTDVEVDIDISEEFVERQQHQQQYSASTAGSSGSMHGAPPLSTAPSSQSHAQSTTDSSFAPAHCESSSARVPVPDEPAPGEEGVVLCKVSLPGGGAVTRRVRRSNDVAILFQFLRSTYERFDQDKILQLSTRFPVRKFVENDVSSLVSFESAGVTSSNEAFLLGYVS